jgi:hypothetical protein
MTEELVDELVQRFNGWNRAGDHGVLRYLNAAHEILMSVDSQQTMVFDTATGKLPTLATTAGVFLYTFPDTIRRIDSVVIEMGQIGVEPFDYGMSTYTGSLAGRSAYKNSLVIAGMQYTKVPYIRSKDRISSTVPASVVFSKDPTTKTDFYRYLAYRTPVQILSESIQVEIPAPLDFDILLPAAAKLIEGVQNGNYDEARRIIRMELRPLLWKELDAGDQGELDMEPVDRGF